MSGIYRMQGDTVRTNNNFWHKCKGIILWRVLKQKIFHRGCPFRKFRANFQHQGLAQHKIWLDICDLRTKLGQNMKFGNYWVIFDATVTKYVKRYIKNVCVGDLSLGWKEPDVLSHLKLSSTSAISMWGRHIFIVGLKSPQYSYHLGCPHLRPQ